MISLFRILLINVLTIDTRLINWNIRAILCIGSTDMSAWDDWLRFSLTNGRARYASLVTDIWWFLSHLLITLKESMNGRGESLSGVLMKMVFIWVLTLVVILLSFKHIIKHFFELSEGDSVIGMELEHFLEHQFDILLWDLVDQLIQQLHINRTVFIIVQFCHRFKWQYVQKSNPQRKHTAFIRHLWEVRCLEGL